MNINQYKKSMDEIRIRTIEPDELLRKQSKKVFQKKYIKLISSFILIFTLIFCINHFNFFGHSINSTIKVYAADNKIELTKDFINIKLNASPVDGGSDSSDCFINYNLNLVCEGDNITTITYTCSDQIINRNNRSSAAAYFVENINVPKSEYSRYLKADNFIYGYQAEGTATAKVTMLIGNSYIDRYDNQNNKQYGLVLTGRIDKNGTYQLDNTIILIEITLKDGSIEHKKLMVSPSKEDPYSSIKLRIL
jgi:hypothetical protein